MEVWYVIGGITFALLVGVSVYLITRKIFNSHSQVIIEQAKAKAKAIEYEAQEKLKDHKIYIKEDTVKLQQQFDKESARLKKDMNLLGGV